MPSERVKAANHGKPASKAASMEWTTARCHRLIRPLTAKLQSLGILLQSPSLATTTLPQAQKKPKQSLDESDYGSKPQRRSGNAHDRSLFFGEGRPGDKIRRTYSANSTTIIPQVVVAATSRTSTAASADDPSHPQMLLESLRSSLKAEVYQLYCGICAAFENILLATKSANESHDLPSLKVIAARRVAQCILASDPGDSDEEWYQYAGMIGVGGEYCRDVVRWQAVELVREAIFSNLLPSQQRSGLGLPAILVGLCRHHNANAEAESLLKSMMEMYPLTENPRNPALVALFSFWQNQKFEMFRLLAGTLIEEGRPTSLSNPSVNQALKVAVECLESSWLSQELITRALETAFGIWGEEYITAAAEQRRELARRKSSRRSRKAVEELEYRKSRDRQRPIARHIVARAENMALELTHKLVVAAQNSHNIVALAILDNLTQGFLVQDEAMRTITEEEWEECYPIAAKVTILLQSLGRETENDVAIAKELLRCLDDLRNEMGKEGLQSLGEFVASCYENLYTSTGKSITGRDEIRALINRLVSYASTGSFSVATDKTGTIDVKAPKTPLKHRNKVITFTPGKVPANPQRERERYFITQLALHVAIGFLKLKCAKDNEAWNEWLRKLEQKLIEMKVRTPAKTKAVSKDTVATPKERKGWRFEEGIAEWVELGGTPGGPFKGKKSQCVIEIPVKVGWKKSWRDDYEIFSDHPAYNGTTTTSSSSFIEDSKGEDMQLPRLDSPDDPDISHAQLSEDGEYYAPTPARAPSSIRRSPRKADRIKRSLRAVAVMLPSSSPAKAMRKRSSRKGPDSPNPTESPSPSASLPAKSNLDSSPLVISSGNIPPQRKSFAEHAAHEDSQDELSSSFYSLSDKKRKAEDGLPKKKLRKRQRVVSVGDDSDDELTHP
jgi:hypothetical protein